MGKQKLKIIFNFLKRGVLAYCLLFTLHFYFKTLQGKPFVPYVTGIFVPLDILANAWILMPHKNLLSLFK